MKTIPVDQLDERLANAIIGGKEHRDPFDRLLISQAIFEGMSIVSDDGKFPHYNIPIIW